MYVQDTVQCWLRKRDTGIEILKYHEDPKLKRILIIRFKVYRF